RLQARARTEPGDAHLRRHRRCLNARARSRSAAVDSSRPHCRTTNQAIEPATTDVDGPAAAMMRLGPRTFRLNRRTARVSGRPILREARVADFLNLVQTNGT